MPANFSVQFIVNEKTQTRVLKLTDTSTGFTLAKGNFSITFPDGSTRIKTDFTSPDISAPSTFINIPAVLDYNNNVITGTYKIDFVALDASATSYSASKTFDFNWIKPTNSITDLSDVIMPQVQFKDNASYSPIGSFTGTVSRTFSVPFPTTSEASAQPATTTTTNTLTPVYTGNYYEGVYNVSNDVSCAYTHSTNSWLTISYVELFTKTVAIKKCPNQLGLIQKLNTYRGVIEAYKEKNDTQFNILSEQYDLAIALYSHIIARYETSTQDGSEGQLRELLSILEPYTGSYSYQSTKMLPFELAVTTANSFNITDNINTDSVQLGSSLLFSGGSAALKPTVSNNQVDFTPVFGSSADTFAQGNDSRFHNAVTIGTANGLSLASQVLSLASATVSTSGAMSASDKAKLDGIAAGANVGTVTSVGLAAPNAFTVTNSPVTGSGTIVLSANGSPLQYITGAGALSTFLTDVRAGISLSTTGSSGSATYNSTTGLFNIPTYTLAGLGGITAAFLSGGAGITYNSSTGVISYNGTIYTDSSIRGLVSAGTGLSYNSTTGVFSNTITQYTDALARLAISLTTTGTSGAATYNSTTGVLNIPQYQGGVTSFNTRTGAITLTSSDVTTALTYTPYPTPAGTTLQYIDGTGGLQTFPATLPTDRMTTTGRNATGSTLYKGTIVYIFGGTGNRPNFVKAQANGEATSAGTFGVVYADIPNNSDGDVVTIGTVNTLDTRSNATNPFTTDTLADGDTIYLSPTIAGYVTNVKPSAPNHLVYIGKVVRTSPTNGTIVYRIQNGYELDEIHNVAISSVANNQSIFWNSTTNLWENKSIVTALGYTPYNATNPNGYTSNVGTVTSVAALTLGTTGTDVSSSVANGTTTPVITLNIPTASATNRGVLSSADWTSFNNKQSALGFTPENSANKGVANGYASLDGSGLIPSTQLPSYVDDVLEFANLAALPATGETGKIYVTLDTNKIYRWSGTAYIEVSPTVGTIWGGITGTLANQTDLQSALNAKQNTLTLTTTGTSGAATLVGSTLNIPQYQGGVTSFNTRTGAITLTSGDVTTALTFTPYNATNPSNFIALTALSSTATGLTYTNTTGVFSLTSGYVIPTTTSTTNWDTAYTNRITTLTTTGSSGSATLSLNTLNIPTYTLAGLGGITASFLSGGTGITYNSSTGVIATTITQYTDALARAAISLTTTGSSGASTYNSTTGVLNIPTYTLSGLGGQASSTNLTSLSGLTYASASFVKMTAAGTFALDTNTYLTSYTETDTLASVTGRGASTSTQVILSGGGNGSTTYSSLVFSGYNQGGGVGYHGFFEVKNTYSSATNPNKFFRMNSTGGIEIINSAYTANIFTLSDNGQLKLPSYTSTTSFSGTAVGTLGFDAGGNIITMASGGGGTTLNGTGFVRMSGTTVSYITGTSSQFVKADGSLDGTAYYAASNPSGYTNNTGTVTSVAALTIGTTGTDLSSSVATGTTTPVITLNVPTASATNRGVLSAADWSTFNGKQNAITLTTTGSSGAATFSAGALNIPNYTLAGLGGQASSTNLTSLSGLSYVSASFVKMTAAGTFALDTNAYYLASNPSGYTNNTGTVTSVAALTLGTTGTDLSSSVATGTTTPVITLNVPTASATNRGALSAADWTTFNSKQTALSGTGFVKASGTTISYDNSTYVPTSGTGATGTWGISISGNAATATNSSQLGGIGLANFVRGTGASSWGYRTTNISGDSLQGVNSGFYDGSSMTNMPTTDWYHLIVNSHYNSYSGNQYEFHIATPFWDKSNFYMRSISPGAIGTWRQLLHNGNYSSYALPLSGGTMTGNITLANFYTSSGTGPTSGLGNNIRIVPTSTLSLNTTYLISITINQGSNSRFASGSFLWRPIANSGYNNYNQASVYFPTNSNTNGTALFAWSSTGGGSAASDVVVGGVGIDFGGTSWSANVKQIG